ncbi:MAG: hypothetical protein EZS28_024089 [Streblomastix strix]|uniref:Uncharacterized protein n=1 Tax=Streblomastix strix TaxID=222440 RepID=A0A5J4VD39_9EUKA|nr:MAG: hypothetical protein EZS28_024089 [Streblomastix strix]
MIEPIIALFILPKWSLDKLRAHVPTKIDEIKMGKAELILEKGKSLEKLNLNMHLGSHYALLLRSIELEKNFMENWLNLLDLINKQYNKCLIAQTGRPGEKEDKDQQ